MDKIRLHVVSLPHTQVTPEYSTCAYTQKALKFCKMMKLAWDHKNEYKVIHYWPEGSNPICDEQVNIISNEERQAFFGGNDRRKDLYSIEWDSTKPYWQLANQNTIIEIAQRIQPQDLILVIGWHCHKPVADAFPNHITVEYGIGYSGVFSKHRVFESYAWMHYIYWETKTANGEFYDTVIPNYFEKEDFEYKYEKKDYLLYIGRMVSRKGVQIAVEVAQRSGKKLILAWQWATQEGNTIKAWEFTVSGDNLEYVGSVWPEERKKLMAEATAVIMPTQYIEPFGGVAVEAMMSGTPVITTDFGAFTETILHGKTWYRCKTMEQFVWAVNNIKKISPIVCNEWARNYTLEAVRPMYDEYFDQLLRLRDKGRYSENPDRNELWHLGKLYP